MTWLYLITTNHVVKPLMSQLGYLGGPILRLGNQWHICGRFSFRCWGSHCEAGRSKSPSTFKSGDFMEEHEELRRETCWIKPVFIFNRISVEWMVKTHRFPVSHAAESLCAKGWRIIVLIRSLLWSTPLWSNESHPTTNLFVGDLRVLTGVGFGILADQGLHCSQSAWIPDTCNKTLWGRLWESALPVWLINIIWMNDEN